MMNELLVRVRAELIMCRNWGTVSADRTMFRYHYYILRCLRLGQSPRQIAGRIAKVLIPKNIRAKPLSLRLVVGHGQVF